MYAFITNYVLQAIAVTVIGYLLGSISFSIIFTKHYAHKDIRAFGSGNAGATNVLRSVGKKAAALTFVFDFLKAVVSMFLGAVVFRFFSPASVDAVVVEIMTKYGVYIGGMSCIFGHIYPLYFGFKGGKGVITTAALMLLMDWRVFLIEMVVFFVSFAIKRIVSLSSILAAAVYPFATLAITVLLDYPYYLARTSMEYAASYVAVTTVVSTVIGILVLVKHRENIKRLRLGEEKPIQFHKS